jgi:biopolymer transport protein ExbD
MTKPEINVTPLIDVLLVLLIIFMIVTPWKPASFDARIPAEPKPNDNADPPKLLLVVSADREGRLRLNNEAETATIAEPAKIIQRLVEVFRQRETNLVYSSGWDGDANMRIEKSVYIKAPRSLDYGSVAKLIDAVKTAGAAPVGLQIDDLD